MKLFHHGTVHHVDIILSLRSWKCCILIFCVKVPKSDEEYDLRVPRDMAYIFSGAYVPLSCKLIEQVQQTTGFFIVCVENDDSPHDLAILVCVTGVRTRWMDRAGRSYQAAKREWICCVRWDNIWCSWSHNLTSKTKSTCNCWTESFWKWSLSPQPATGQKAMHSASSLSCSSVAAPSLRFQLYVSSAERRVKKIPIMNALFR